jgi:plasmid stabilization system protein ParE
LADVLISPEAQNDLMEIRTYIVEELLNPPAAERVVARIGKSISILKDSPEIGTPLSSVVDIETNYRFIVSGKYISFYRYEEPTCFVDRILYGGRNYLKILFDEITPDNEEDSTVY